LTRPPIRIKEMAMILSFSSFDAYRDEIENERSTTMKEFPSNTVFTQTLG
jgi:hypothetical protein